MVPFLVHSAPFFNGVALLLAVGLSKYQRTARRSAAVARILRRGARRG
jgi:hypothetical protein